MEIILSILAIAVIVAIVLNYKKEEVESHSDTPVDNTPTPIEDESVKPEKPKQI